MPCANSSTWCSRSPERIDAKVARLPPDQPLTLELVEDSVVNDLARTHSRRLLADGTELDETAYGEFGALVTYHRLPGGYIEFIDFVFFDR